MTPGMTSRAIAARRDARYQRAWPIRGGGPPLQPGEPENLESRRGIGLDTAGLATDRAPASNPVGSCRPYAPLIGQPNHRFVPALIGGGRARSESIGSGMDFLDQLGVAQRASRRLPGSARVVRAGATPDATQTGSNQRNEIPGRVLQDARWPAEASPPHAIPRSPGYTRPDGPAPPPSAPHAQAARAGTSVVLTQPGSSPLHAASAWLGSLHDSWCAPGDLAEEVVSGSARMGPTTQAAA
jgi:hypothetical protein